MKFHVESLHLWLASGKIRTLSFLPNKVNVITGASHTGKTAILDIFDYCFFASRHRISESIINENTLWYGLKIHVNDKVYTLARRAPSGPDVSSDYYFSSIGEIPDDAPEANIREPALKVQLGADFGIDQDVRIPFGGRYLQAGSRISLRYFLLFNTISQDIITHSEQFFDKQDQPRSREALPRIFDIAVGIDTVENILKRDKRAQLEKRLARLQKQSAKTDEDREAFYGELAETTARAMSYGLISDNSDAEQAVANLQRMVFERETGSEFFVSGRHEEISAELYRVSRKIKGLRKFLGEYSTHKSVLSETADSLKPIAYLRENYADTVRTSVFFEILDRLGKGLLEIKKEISKKNPLDSNIEELIKELEDQRGRLQGELQALPSGSSVFENEKERYIFIGETKAKLELLKGSDQNSSRNFEADIANLERQIGEINVLPAEERRKHFTSVLDETIQEYIALSKVALGNYGEYRASFDYKEKKLHLRKPKTTFIENVGSSSNHMFLHLFLFLGLHEVIMANGGRHVAPFLIIDQFSRPYWGDDENGGVKSEQPDEQDRDVNESDVAKVHSALKLLDHFISQTSSAGKEFQIILFEHIKPKYWENLENFHLVEIFRDGNALIQGAQAR
ncbi:DUF3732 domain-containing protein [Cereibacter sphaeroides]|uniref:DUF3732 domain-containing protein n=1 Tax=Cereibacter sphaeroides TaxID=1063 RepID=UPI001F1961DF|nr:DUF3732 domain-containing protein [Cereibacter sphaeroides]MCE6957982.1 DUF3732 domain-containing protein [Cereibacter sphaeroides]MCE6971789.1 DUF3732 domain-containing protein [Cereibacter sphaeroides]